MNERLTIDIIIGPTASGKSAYALNRADDTDGIIINADAMQCYDALPILSAQPDQADLTMAPHRLYSFLDASGSLSAQDWRHIAEQEIRTAHDNGQNPILTGGSGFYINALIYGFSQIPQIPNEVREHTRQRHEQLGNPAFHADLESFDPEMAAQLNPNDSQRLQRAYEVFKTTGKSLAYWQAQPRQGPPDNMNFNVTFLTRPRPILHDRINKRFDIMMNMGVMDEVKILSERIDSDEVAEDSLIVMAHGFRPLRHYLKGEWTYEQAADKTRAETRQYAKRQETWGRGQLKTTDHVTKIDKIILE